MARVFFAGLFIGLITLRTFDFGKSKKKRQTTNLMSGKVSETLENYCLACCLDKNLKST